MNKATKSHKIETENERKTKLDMFCITTAIAMSQSKIQQITFYLFSDLCLINVMKIQLNPDISLP